MAAAKSTMSFNDFLTAGSFTSTLAHWNRNRFNGDINLGKLVGFGRNSPIHPDQGKRKNQKKRAPGAARQSTRESPHAIH